MPTTVGVTIAVPPPHGQVLQDVRRRSGDPMADAVPSHVTLLPPTQVADEQLEALQDHLVGVAAAARPFRMTLQGSGTFRPVSPVVFAAVAEGIADCERLQTQVRGGPVERPLEFPYHPHVTVAHGVPEAALDTAFADLAAFSASFGVDRFELFRSGDDLVWRTVREFPFGS